MGAVTESPYRLAWRVTEPLHAMIYFVPEAPERYAAFGIRPMDGYFGSRGAAFGPVGPGIVAATFYNFNPARVARALPAVWSKASPEQLLAARLDAADAALTRGLGVEVVNGPEVAEAAALARRAAEKAVTLPHGRPLFAAHAALPWPDRPHLVLFHAQTLLREFRGDGHVAALLANGISGLDAIVMYEASGASPAGLLRTTRGWSAEQWAEAEDDLRRSGLMDADGKLTEAGVALRAHVEDRTDQVAEVAYRAIGEDGCRRLAELTRPLSRTVVKGGLLNPMSLITHSSRPNHLPEGNR
ncbi:SCO6745 family protein [Actinoplanes sp. CA-252034]|uniref:SCO6745 family protein n=1 Tax=Actinoplanes sp. CA-252034 TaxID=3239906 RepID=UPI003D96D315